MAACPVLKGVTVFQRSLRPKGTACRLAITLAICAITGFAPRVSAQTLSAASSNPVLLPSNAITFGGSGSNTVVTITPASDIGGSANVTLFANGNALRIDSSIKVPGQSTLTVRINGSGSVTPDLASQVLQIGASYTVTAIPAAGYAFANWSGDVSGTLPLLTFVMQSNLVLVANFVDASKPFVAVTSPSPNSTVTNANITVQGTATDNVGVARVLYQVNGSAFQQANGTANWTAPVTLNAGANTLTFKAVDFAGNESALISLTVTYAVRAPISITTVGSGSVTPNLHGQWLDVGRSYTVTASPATGYAFSNWSGTVSASTAQLTFTMQSNMTLVATFVDSGRPTIVITSPATDTRVTNSVATVSGSASDNTGVAQVLYRVRGGAFQPASGTTTWSALVNLAAGPNLVEVKSVDTGGNESALAARTITNVVVSQLAITTTGQGSVTPNLNGQLLEIGKSYTVTAAPATGYAFSNWSGSVSASTAQLTFTMQSNLTLVANFVDSARPTISITSPATDIRVTNGVATVSGSASDNTGVTEVLFRVGSGSFQAASGTTAWSATISLAAGPNRVEVKARDAAANESLVAVRNITNVVAEALVLTTTGQGSVTPDLNGQLLEIGRSYTVTAQPAAGYAFTNWTGDASATTPQLTFVMQPGLTLTANFIDATKPSVAIASPASNSTVTNAMVTLQGTATDNTGVSEVSYSLNGDAFQPANGTTSWSASLSLKSKTNTVRVKCKDISGNESSIVSHNLTYSSKGLMRLAKRGKGTVSPDLDNQMLEVGTTYTLSATASTGYRFADWSGSMVSTNTRIAFTMETNFSLTARFVDSAKPAVTIATPAAGARLTNGAVIFTGKATDNEGVAEVLYSINGGPFQAASGGSNWAASLNLPAGPNTIQVKSVDLGGLESPIVSRSVTSVAMSPIAMSLTGAGTIAPKHGQYLEIGKVYTATAKPAAGYVLTNWTGSVLTNRTSFSFVMRSNLTLTANFVDVAKPVVTITAPASGARVTNSTVMISGRATDNQGVAQVLYQLNNDPFQVATGTSNWSATLTVPAGPNTIRVKAIDLSGRESLLVSRAFTYVVMYPIAISITGSGTVTPLNGQWLEVGKTYTATASPRTGYALTNWTGGVLTNRASFSFVMRSNLTLTANFVDVAKPVVTITAPVAGARVTNSTVTISGRATDNQGVTQVLYQLNSDPFQIATGTSNWSAILTVPAGPNTIRVKAVDLAGHESVLLSRAFTYVVMHPIAISTTGRGTVTPLDGQWLEVGKTYTAVARPGTGFVLTNWTGSVSTNRASFSFVMQSNLTLTANFVDIARPIVTIVAPAAGARFTNAPVTFQGRASDNFGVAQVLYELNSGGWQVATGTSNWTAAVSLAAGPNVFRVRAVDVTGWESPIVTRSVTHAVMWPLDLSIVGNGTVTPNLDGKLLEIGKKYTLTAAPAAGHLLSNWVGSVYSETAALSFTMGSNFTLTAQFAPNPFVPVKGNYTGLFYEGDGVIHESSGCLKLTVTDRGTFSASLVGAGQTLPFSGAFNLAGHTRFTLPRPGKVPLTLDLQLDLSDQTRQVTGTISDGAWTASYTGDRSLWNATNNPLQGKYTVLLPGTPGSTTFPAGHGYGAVTIDRAGNLLFSGRSADGQVLSQAVPVAQGGQWPFYVPIYAGKGSMLSWLTFTNQSGEPLHGLLSWIKPPQAVAHYPAGFNHEVVVASSLFVPPTTNRIANLRLIRVIASEGNLAAPVTNYVELTWANTIWNTNTSGKFSLTLNKYTGLMSGSFKIPGTATVRSFYATLLQNRNAGFGYFLGTNQSGQVRIEAAD